MADIGHEHLHHLASRLHKTNQHLANIRQKFSGAVHRVKGTLEVAGGAWLGGAIEGRSDGYAIMGVVPVNLALGLVAIGAAHLPSMEDWSTDLSNIGNGFVSSYLAAVGYAWGKRWKEAGGGITQMFGHHSIAHPYNLPAAASGELSPQQMAEVVSRMQQAAGAQ